MITVYPGLCRCSNCGRIFIGLKASGGIIYKTKTEAAVLCRRCRERTGEEKKPGAK